MCIYASILKIDEVELFRFLEIPFWCDPMYPSTVQFEAEPFASDCFSSSMIVLKFANSY